MVVGSAGWIWVKAITGRVRLRLNPLCQQLQDALQLRDQEIQRIAQPQRIDIVEHVHRSRPEVDDRPADGALFGKGANLRHQVVAQFTLKGFGTRNIDFVLVGT